MNRVFLIGHLGGDPEIRNAGQTKVCSLRLATTEKWTNRDTQEKHEKTDWHNVEFWATQAENVAKFFKKGDMIIVEGSLETQSWDDKDTGKKNYKTIVRGRFFEFPGNKREGRSSEGSDAGRKDDRPPPDDDGLGF